MPELHKLTPLLSVLQDEGFAVALVTDGRMSGASGKVPRRFICRRRRRQGGRVARVRDGDRVCLDLEAGALNVVAEDDAWLRRRPAAVDLRDNCVGGGRSCSVGCGGWRGGADTTETALFCAEEEEGADVG